MDEGEEDMADTPRQNKDDNNNSIYARGLAFTNDLSCGRQRYPFGWLGAYHVRFQPRIYLC